VHLQSDVTFCLEMPEQRVKMVNFDVCKKPHCNVSSTTAKLFQFYMSLLMLKNWWSLVQYLLRYLVWYVDFCFSSQKVQKLPARSLGLVDRSSPKKQNCDIWIRCKMPACWIKVISQILLKIGCHANVPKGINKKVWIDKIHANTFHLVKRSWKSVQ